MLLGGGGFTTVPPGNYWYLKGHTSAFFQAAWSTVNPTTILDDNAAGDTATWLAEDGSFVAQNCITVFYDNLSATDGSVPIFLDFTVQTHANPVVIPLGGVPDPYANYWALEGSNDHISWTSILYVGETLNHEGFARRQMFLFIASFRYFRFSVGLVGDYRSCNTNLSDMRITQPGPNEILSGNVDMSNDVNLSWT